MPKFKFRQTVKFKKSSFYSGHYGEIIQHKEDIDGEDWDAYKVRIRVLDDNDSLPEIYEVWIREYELEVDND